MIRSWIYLDAGVCGSFDLLQNETNRDDKEVDGGE